MPNREEPTEEQIVAFYRRIGAIAWNKDYCVVREKVSGMLCPVPRYCVVADIKRLQAKVDNEVLYL